MLASYRMKEERGSNSMINIDLKARLKNKAFWVAIASAMTLLAQQLGLNVIPENYTEIVNSVLTILAMLGIIVDTSTPGISDQIKTNSVNSTENEKSEQ